MELTAKDIKQKIDTYNEIFDIQEELVPELMTYFYYVKDMFPMINHPLVQSLMHPPTHNAFVNRQLIEKKEKAERFLKDENYSSYVFLHERPYRLQAFEKIHKKLNDFDYWLLLGEIWIDSENIWQNKPIWKKYLTSERPQRESIMYDEDKEYFDSLPDKLTIYRGYSKQHNNQKGFSYTLSKEKAEWFANVVCRPKGNGEVIRKTVKKADCLAYFDTRNEQEIIYLK